MQPQQHNRKPLPVDCRQKTEIAHRECSYTMKTKDRIQSFLQILLVVGVIANTAISCVIALQLRNDRSALKNLENDLQQVKEALEVEIELRQNIFPQLQKSAQLLRRYNPRLDRMTALSYASKIYECSDETVSFDILNALIVVESSANHRAISSEGALGLTQIMPEIWNYDYETLINPLSKHRNRRCHPEVIC